MSFVFVFDNEIICFRLCVIWYLIIIIFGFKFCYVVGKREYVW